MNQGEEARGDLAFSPLTTSPLCLTLTDAYAYCRRITRESSSNFYHAFRLLPAERHDALCALYAFCRFMDDIADQPDVLPPQQRQGSRKEQLAVLLNTWREELRRCYAGSPRHPISQALTDTVQRFPIAQKHLTGIIDGVEMDLHRNCYRTFAELYDYCYHVASLVGLVCIEIFGYRNPSARDYAINLGVAFQLTNILRDVAEDARRDRVYLPAEDLARFGYAEHDLRAGVYNDAFIRLMAFEGERAREYYGRAVASLAPEDRRTLAAAEAMRLIYGRLLDKLVARNFQVFGTRVTLTTPGKIGLALTAWARGWLPL
ncbi:MAG: presqualene diphosphate synthase HpnD [Deltaproteobacteria bacterium]|nr:presqualene diphosphate synthase HpnD [Deltaproteobacteria bacterium]